MNCDIKPLILRGKSKNYHVVLAIGKATFLELSTCKEEYLNANELQYYRSIPALSRQYSYLQGRYTAKKALEIYLNITDCTEIEIVNGIFNQPTIHHSMANNTQVSIAHSGYWAAAIAFPEVVPLGIDIEMIDATRDWNKLISMTSSEEKMLSNLTSQSPQESLTLLWTIKEALSKAIKTGFTIDLKILEIAEVREQEGFWESTFLYFVSYKAYSWRTQGYFWSIVVPVKVNVIGLPLHHD